MGEPVFLALLTADRVITEKNEKKGIIGTFNRLGSPVFPARFPPWWIYASATNLSGEHTFSLQIVSAEEEKRLFSAQGKLQVASTDQIIEISLPVATCAFPAPGSYTVMFEIDESFLGARVLKVDRIDPPASQPGAT